MPGCRIYNAWGQVGLWSLVTDQKGWWMQCLCHLWKAMQALGSWEQQEAQPCVLSLGPWEPGTVQQWVAGLFSRAARARTDVLFGPGLVALRKMRSRCGTSAACHSWSSLEARPASGIHSQAAEADSPVASWHPIWCPFHILSGCPDQILHSWDTSSRAT